MAGIAPHAGFRIGHVTRTEERTGVTVLLFDAPTMTAAEVRGAAPGTRDLELLKPGMLGQSTDAIVLTGGSTFGLRTVDGALGQLAADGRGTTFGGVVIPLVCGAVVFDLANGSPTVPEVEDGAAAVRNALPVERVEIGRVGAGTGVRWGHLRTDGPSPGGFGIGQIRLPEGIVTAVAVVNALGSVRAASPDVRTEFLERLSDSQQAGENTTLVAVVTDIECSHGDLVRLCIAGHDGLSNAIVPAHTMFDGDVVFTSTTNTGSIDPNNLLRLFIATELAVEAAIGQAIQ
ncbi:MAG: P1 family peptidase [Thermomicrobiales bacterium]